MSPQDRAGGRGIWTERIWPGLSAGHITHTVICSQAFLHAARSTDAHPASITLLVVFMDSSFLTHPSTMLQAAHRHPSCSNFQRPDGSNYL
jgi:hypothetical protein